MQEIERREDILKETPGGDARLWKMELESADKAEKEYRENAKKLTEKYGAFDENRGGDFNLHHANVQVLKPVLLSQEPKPDVRRRFLKTDPLGKQMSIMIERALAYTAEMTDLMAELENTRDGCLITGRGVTRVLYRPTIIQRTDNVQRINQETGEIEIVEVTSDEIADQELVTLHVDYDDFRISPAKRWQDVRWVAFRHTPNRAELEKQFGDRSKEVPLDFTLEIDSREKRDEDSRHGDVFKRAEVWEIWCGESRQRIWYASGMKELLSVEEDPYRLEGFFPMPKPLYAFEVPGTMRPQADYEIYRKQAETVNRTSHRINKIVEEVKVAGIFNEVAKDAAEKMIKLRDGEFKPVLAIDPNARISDMIMFWPIREIADVLVTLVSIRDQALNTVYQMTGLSDIVRGSTNANETATAQQLKGNFATQRMQPRTQPMQRHVRDLFRIMAEMIAEHYQPEVLAHMTGIEPTPEMMQILRDDRLRSYSIDIQTDSTVMADEQQEKENRIEFITAVNDFMEKVGPMVQQGVMPMKTAVRMLRFGADAFKVGRELDDEFDEMEERAMQEAQQPKKPSEEQQKAMLEQQKMQGQMQMKQAELQLKQQEAMLKAQIQQREAQADIAFDQMKAENEIRIDRQKAASDIDIQNRKAEAQIDNMRQQKQEQDYRRTL